MKYDPKISKVFSRTRLLSYLIELAYELKPFSYTQASNDLQTSRQTIAHSIIYLEALTLLERTGWRNHTRYEYIYIRCVDALVACDNTPYPKAWTNRIRAEKLLKLTNKFIQDFNNA